MCDWQRLPSCGMCSQIHVLSYRLPANGTVLGGCLGFRCFRTHLTPNAATQHFCIAATFSESGQDETYEQTTLHSANERTTFLTANGVSRGSNGVVSENDSLQLALWLGVCRLTCAEWHENKRLLDLASTGSPG